MTIYLGIDPGKEGGWAVVDHKGAALVAGPLPYIGRELDPISFLATLKPLGIDICVTEKPMPVKGSGTTTAFTTGKNYGIILCVLSFLEARREEVSPSVWKKAKNLSADKQASVELALKLFPDQRSVLLGPRGGGQDGIAEALLIADWRRGKDSK